MIRDIDELNSQIKNKKIQVNSSSFKVRRGLRFFLGIEYQEEKLLLPRLVILNQQDELVAEASFDDFLDISLLGEMTVPVVSLLSYLPNLHEAIANVVAHLIVCKCRLEVELDDSLHPQEIVFGISTEIKGKKWGSNIYASFEKHKNLLEKI